MFGRVRIALVPSSKALRMSYFSVCLNLMMSLCRFINAASGETQRMVDAIENLTEKQGKTIVDAIENLTEKQGKTVVDAIENLTEKQGKTVVDAIEILTKVVQEKLPPEKEMSTRGKQSSFPATKCLVQCLYLSLIRSLPLLHCLCYHLLLCFYQHVNRLLLGALLAGYCLRGYLIFGNNPTAQVSRHLAPLDHRLHRRRRTNPNWN